MLHLLKCLLTKNECYKTGEAFKPIGVMIHSTGSNNPWLRRYVQPTSNCANYAELLAALGVNNNGNDWNHDNAYWQTYFKKNLNACVHGFIGKLADGTVAAVQTLPWDMRGWHSGWGNNGTANDTHISFEICEDGLKDRSYFNQIYDQAVELTAYLCELHGFDPLEDGVIICHSEGCKRGVASNHADVMHWFPKHGKDMNMFRSDVKTKMMEHEAVVETKPAQTDPAYEQFKAMMNRYRAELQSEAGSNWSAKERQWCIANGIVKGDANTNFMWEDFITREATATLIYRLAEKLGAL